MNTVLTDIRIALRRHLRQRAFSVTVVFTLAVTIAATTTVSSVVTGVLVRALPFASPDRLVWVASVRTDNSNAPFTLPEFIDYRSRTRTLSGLAAYANWSASLAGSGVTERLQGARLSANAFDVLGVSPAAGRLFNDGDDRPDAARVVVLSYRLWLQRYGAAPDAVGRTVRINAEPFVIIGVLPAQFPLPLREIDVVTPLAPDRDPLRNARNSVNFLRLFGRLAPGIDEGQAQAELTTICLALRQQFPVEYARKAAVKIAGLHAVLVADYRESMWLLVGAVIVVLATAIANVVSLALVQASARARELTTRLALGASRLHLVRQLTIEALLLSSVASAIGWALASQAVAATVRGAPASIPRLDEVFVDSTATLVVAGVMALVTVLLAVAQLGTTARARAGDALRLAGRGAIGDRWSHRLRTAIVVAEVAAALVLVLVTATLGDNLQRLRDVQPGFRPDGVFQARVAIPPSYESPEDVSRFYERLSDRLNASPGVTRVGVISIAPLSGLLATVPFTVAGQPSAERDRASANLRVVSPEYLSTVGTQVLQGRPFAESDRPDAEPVALVSAALARRFLSGRALGQRLLIDDNNHGPRPVEIVGIVEDVHHTALDVAPALDVYIPLRQVHPDGVALIRNNQFWLVRTNSEAAAFRETFATHLRAVHRDAALSTSGPMREFVDASLGPRRFNLGVVGAFALTAVLLALLGLYGLVSYAVTERRQEIGLRMAIGATSRDVQFMVLRQAARLGTTGAAIGLALAQALHPSIGRMIPSTGIILRDAWVNPVTAAAAGSVLVAVVLIAAYVPARRAARIDPTAALKAQ